MSKKLFNMETMPATGRGRSAEPVMSISASHQITFNKQAIELMGLTGKEDAKFEFAQSETEPTEFSVSIGAKGFPAKIKPDGTVFSHKDLSCHIKEAFECPHNWIIRFKVAKDGKSFNLLKLGVKQPQSRA